MPVTKKFLESLVLTIRSETINMSGYDSRIVNLSITATEVEIWWHTPPMEKVLLFEDPDIPNKPYNIPAMIWRYNTGNQDIYTYATDAITIDMVPKLPLYLTPFYNSDNAGLLCAGSASKYLLPSVNFTEIIENVMEVFFDSEFTHVGHTKYDPGDIDRYWQANKGNTENLIAYARSFKQFVADQ